MVKSLLDDTVNYIENSDIDIDDLEHNANLYETKIYKKDKQGHFLTAATCPSPY